MKNNYLKPIETGLYPWRYILVTAVLFSVQETRAANTFPASGNVGIGTTTPANLLELAPPTGTNALLMYRRPTTNQSAWAQFATGATNDWGVGTAANGSDFGIFNYGLGVNSIFIDKANNLVGIGTDYPWTRLYVAGLQTVTTGDVSGIPWPYAGGLPSTLNVVQNPSYEGAAIVRAAVDTKPSSLILFKTRSADPTLNVAPAIGDEIGKITWQVPDAGGTVRVSSALGAGVTGVDLTSVASYLNFSTTPLAGTTTERVRIDSLGRVGIGTNAPSATLHVKATAGTTPFYLQGTSTNITLDPNGSSTIGGALSVAGTFTSTGTVTANNGTISGGTSALNLLAGGTNQNITLTPSGTGYTLLNGFVGIGTSAPQSRLSVSGQVVIGDPYKGDASLQISKSYGGMGRLTQISPFGASLDALNIMASTDAASSYSWWTWGVRGNKWMINPGVGFGNAFTIDPSGNVGIGTSAPQSILHLNGNAAGELELLRLSNRHGSETTLDTIAIRMGVEAGGEWSKGGIFFERTGAYGVGKLYFALNSYVDNSSVTKANAVMTLAPSGNVGIGTTTPGSLLDVVRSTGGDASYAYPAGSWSGRVLNRIDNSTENGLVVANRWASASSTAFAVGSMFNQGSGFSTYFKIDGIGNVGIGTSNPTQKLSVNGTIRAKEIIVDTGWADYVFEPTYRLAPLSEVEQHIKTQKHLPGIPSAAEIAANGASMGDLQTKMMSKIEELTLHLIQQEKEITALRQQVQDLQKSTVR